MTRLTCLDARFLPNPQPREVGNITSVSTGVAKLSGLPAAGSQELMSFPAGLPGLACNVDETAIGGVLLGD